MSIKDWKGMRVGAPQSAVPQIIAILDYNGLKFEDITFVQGTVPALMQDQVDVVGTWPTNKAALAPRHCASRRLQLPIHLGQRAAVPSRTT